MSGIDEIRTLVGELAAQLRGLHAELPAVNTQELDELLSFAAGLYRDLSERNVDEQRVSFRQELGAPRWTLEEIRAVIRKIDAFTKADQEPPSTLVGELDRNTTELQERLAELVDELMKSASAGEYLAEHYRNILRIGNAIDTRRVRAETKTVLADAQKAATAAREVAGAASEAVLAREFGTYAAAENRTANRLRIGAAALVMLTVAVAAAIVLFSDFGSLSVGEELGRLALTLPVAALAAYFGRESSRHRDVATWAQALHVQLRTIDAYCESLTDTTARDQLRLEFGRHIFVANRGVPAALAHGPSLFEDAAQIAEVARAQVKR